MKRFSVHSWSELQAEGWKSSYSKIYCGNQRHPDKELSSVYPEMILGQELLALRWDDQDREKVLVKNKFGIEKVVPLWLFKDKIGLVKHLESKCFKVGKKKAFFHPDGTFEFPCDCSEMSIKQARALAKWVIGVSK